MASKGFGKQLKGSGGIFGSKPKRPVEQRQSRFGQSVMDIVACLSEGTIEGFYTGAEPLKSIYIDKTPIQNADGSLNYNISGWDFRAGVPWQDPMLGFGDSVSSNTAIAQEVVWNLPITKTIINKNVDAILVTVTVVSQQYPENGGVLAAPVHFKIWIRQGNGAWELRHDVQLNEVFASPTPFEFNCPVNNFSGTVSQFQIRLERITPTDSDSRYQRQVQWATYQEVIETKLRYPSLAVFALRLDRAQFEDNVGEVAVRIKGRTVAIPNNAAIAPDGGINFSGLWNGTFYEPPKAARCPAMQLLDLMTNTRYGLGKRIKLSNTDRSSFYTLSQYCNGLVPNGKGGFERRFACDIVLDNKEDAKRVLDTYRTIFRGFAYYLDGAIRVGADMPVTGVVHQFTQADIEDGLFEYSDQVGLKGLNTRCIVWWNDPDNFFERTPEYVEDRDGIALYGLNEIEISLPGCTSQGQAHRAGLATLLADRVRYLAVTFRARLKGAMVVPGDVIQIADAKQANEEVGGLIASVNPQANNFITLDRPVRILPNVNYVLYCTLPNGVVEERAIGSAPGNTSTVAVWPPYSQTPVPESNWVLASVIVEPQKFQVTNIVPVDGSNYTLYEIQGVLYEPSFYAAVEQGLSIVPRSTRVIAPAVVSLPRTPTAVLRFVSSQPVVNLAWLFAANQNGGRDEFIDSYLVEWRRGSGDNWGGTQLVRGLSYELQNPVEGNYTFRVAAVDTAGKQSQWIESNVVLVSRVNAYAVFTSPQTTMFAMD